MSKHSPKSEFPGNIRDTPLAEALSGRYLAYALSTIMSRSLPDVRDGVKPVQRRLLHAMRLLRLDPNSGFKKCARIVGDVMGKFHPHGDQSIYDAMVRLAQQFSQRYPLVDGQGNFGNVDGDNPAAMRYTEARLTKIAEYLLDGIDEDTVDFRATYDGTETEPVVLPAAFPNLLANGASGIAVGMATSIPPHNVGELCDALLHLLKFPNATAAKLIDFVPGPDFPTGGILIEARANIVEAYKTGRGSFRLRASWRKEELERGQWRIVVDEIPYQVPKGRLVERIAELLSEKKLPLLADIHDESAEDIRLVFEPKSRAVDPDMLMESLFRATDLEVRFPLNLNVLDRGLVPKVMSLRDALRAFLDHRHAVLIRQSKFRLDAIERRLEILDGFLIAYRNLDAVIKIIRDEDEPKPVLMRRFRLNDIQAEAILNLRLRSLRKLEELEIKSEHERLGAERAELKKLLRDEAKRWSRIGDELRALKKSVGDRRRTALADAPTIVEVPIEAMVEREAITVLCSEKGWIRALKGHVADDSAASYKEGDRERFRLFAETTDKLLLFGTNGRAYAIGADKLPRGRGQGEPVRLLIDLGDEDDVVALLAHRPGHWLLVAAADGRGFVVAEDEMLAQTRNGKQILDVGAGIEAAVCVPAKGDTVATVGDNRKMLLFPLDELPRMTRGRGVRLQRYREGGLRDARVFILKDGLSWTDSSSRVRIETDLRDWLGQRGQAGRLPPKGFNKTNRFG